MKYLIALDGGGSKTDSVLFDETGRVLKRYIGKGGNATDIGKEEAYSRFYDCLEHLLDGFSKKVAIIYGGMAGVLPNGDFYSPRLKGKFPDSVLHFEDDGYNLLSGGIGHRDGCGMICGTGSSLFIRIKGQPLRHIGGKGYLIDTGGSGFDLGQQAIKKALQSVDGRIGSTVLTELLAEIIGMPINDAVIPVVHRGGRPFIASFAKAVFEGRKAGDPVCQEIFNNGASQLADLTFVADKFFEGSYLIVVGGGIIQAYPEYVEAIKEMGSCRANYIVSDTPPVYGASVEAMSDIGMEVNEDFKHHFMGSFQVGQ